MKTFKVNTVNGVIEIEYVDEFTYLGRKYMLHKSVTFLDMYNVTDYLTGYKMPGSWSNKRTAIKESKAILNQYKTRLTDVFKNLKVINP